MSSSSGYEPARSRTDERAERYDARDAPSASSNHLRNLYAALYTPVRHFTVEFLYANDKKHHVVFKLNFSRPIGSGERPIQSARVSMELEKGIRTGRLGPGACEIKLCRYTGRTRSATAGFQFPVRGGFTLREMLAVIRGTDPQLPDTMRSDTTLFDFANRNGFYAGCRDWLAQVFVRLHRVGAVNWSISGILGPDDRTLVYESLRPEPGNSAIDWRRAGFHTVIGRFFEEPDWDDRVTVVAYRDLPMSTGHFWAPNFQRFTTDASGRGHRLPYRSSSQQQAASFSGRGGSSSSGRGGSSSAGSGGHSSWGARGGASAATRGGSTWRGQGYY